jgi:UDPglucose 6-dehydrogenase
MTLCKDAYEAVEGAEAMVIVTEWNEFRMLDLPRARDLMAEPRMLDLRNIYKRDAVLAAGFQYWGVGR